ncbi:hypothetical protein C5F47_03330 [Nitrosopumilus cobalaminigenes]|uniref:Uncharacterized protein n=1 Tax=Nitrosopumilus cobalaminigenes TaxID=1470066 RepID=A0A7D5R256_9ARCH|nr:hypothetical protein C5F47_03330 [Nitrosopumilus cobalaminigenes]
MSDEKSVMDATTWKIKNLENRLHLHKQALEGNKNDIILRSEDYINTLKNWRTTVLTILGTLITVILFGIPIIFGIANRPDESSSLINSMLLGVVPSGIILFVILIYVEHSAFHIVGKIKERYARILSFISSQQDALLETTYDQDNITNDEIDNFDSFLLLAYLIEKKMVYESLQGPYGSNFLSKGVKNKMDAYMDNPDEDELNDAMSDVNFEILPKSLLPWINPYK